MVIKANDMCPRCKYCLGMTPQGMYSCGKAGDGSELNIGIDVVLNCANFELKDRKVEGKVADFCPKCKNCKSTTMERDGKKNRLTEVECEDPYDGMKKILAADSDVCCSMFEPVTSKDKYSELEARELIKDYREKSKNYEQILNDILDTVYEHPEMFERNMTTYLLLPGRVKTLKDSWDMMCDKYDHLNVENEQRKKAMDNQAKMIQDLKKVPICKEILNGILELKDRKKELEKELNKVKAHDEALTKHFQNDEKLIDSIQKVIFPQEEGSDYTYSYYEILNKVKELKSDVDTLQNKNTSLNTINKGLSEDRKKLINYIRSLKIASENYLKEFTYEEESDNG